MGTRRNALTMIELLIVITTIALLLSILLPALSRTRQYARLALCVANLRSQGLVIQQYTVEYEGRLPPAHVQRFGTGAGAWLINRTLASYDDQPFQPRSDGSFEIPTGIWRCPNIPSSEDNAERWTHSGIIHHAPNTWLFNTIRINEDADFLFITSNVYPGWDVILDLSAWRRIDRVGQPSNIIALIDNANFASPGHGAKGRQAYELIGTSCDIVNDPTCPKDHIGSHDALRRRPAVFVDGHAESLPATSAYWLGAAATYIPPGDPANPVMLYDREVRHFMWFIRNSQ